MLGIGTGVEESIDTLSNRQFGRGHGIVAQMLNLCNDIVNRPIWNLEDIGEKSLDIIVMAIVPGKNRFGFNKIRCFPEAVFPASPTILISIPYVVAGIEE